jgi:hypothetical protein
MIFPNLFNLTNVGRTIHKRIKTSLDPLKLP